MKFNKYHWTPKQWVVALFVSAWIEISVEKRSGIKRRVALFVSAWIEILELGQKLYLTRVALFVSAWIEI